MSRNGAQNDVAIIIRQVGVAQRKGKQVGAFFVICLPGVSLGCLSSVHFEGVSGYPRFLDESAQSTQSKCSAIQVLNGRSLAAANT